MLYTRLCEKIVSRHGGDTEASRREAWGTVGSLTGIAANLLLSLIKFAVGLSTGSVAATADAANNLSDAGGSIMSLASVRLANRHETDSNPFGFGRMEYLGALGVGVLIVIMGIELFRSGIEGILHPEAAAFSWLSLGLMGFSILVKVWLYFVYRRIGKPIQNTALLAAAKDSLSDCIATGAVIVSMLLEKCFGWQVDGYIGLLVSLLVFYAGFEVLRDTVNRLLGGKPDHELGDRLIARVKSYPYVQGVHDFVMHDYGPGRCMASIHVEVPADGSLVAMHEVIDQMERDIYAEFHVPLCVHMDPVAEPDAHIKAAEDALRAYLKEREQIQPLEGHEEALFLSLQKRRITQRAIENLVKKYAAIAAPLKRKISPHKLRSTYGTTLYNETGDIYLVADVLGHADVNTTRRHYAAMSDSRRRMAAKAVKLREDAPEE